MTARKRLAVIQRVYRQWAAEQTGVQPDPQYVHDGPSQYAEGMVALSAPTAAQDEFHRRVEAELKAAGLPPRV